MSFGSIIFGILDKVPWLMSFSKDALDHDKQIFCKVDAIVPETFVKELIEFQIGDEYSKFQLDRIGEISEFRRMTSNSFRSKKISRKFYDFCTSLGVLRRLIHENYFLTEGADVYKLREWTSSCSKEKFNVIRNEHSSSANDVDEKYFEFRDAVKKLLNV